MVVHPCLKSGHDPRSLAADCPFCKADKEGGAHHRNWTHGGEYDPSCAICKQAKHAETAPCGTCGDGVRLKLTKPVAEPENVTRINLPGQRCFNPAIIDDGGGIILAYREGWAGAVIRSAKLGSDLRPTRLDPKPLIVHPGLIGVEDPRLFIHQDRLHCQFAGVEERGERVGIYLADLDRDQTWKPNYPDAQPVEKNWGPFSFDGRLFAVYSISPHRVLEFRDGNTIAAHFDRGPNAWPTGELFRGGSAPVRVGNEYYSFFHSWKRIVGKKVGNEWKTHDYYQYGVGVYTFEAEPPFRVRRYCRGPIWMPTGKCVTTPDKSVIFPGGAIFDGRRWLVSAGHQDCECLIGEFSHEQIEAVLNA